MLFQELIQKVFNRYSENIILQYPTSCISLSYINKLSCWLTKKIKTVELEEGYTCGIFLTNYEEVLSSIVSISISNKSICIIDIDEPINNIAEVILLANIKLIIVNDFSYKYFKIHFSDILEQLTFINVGELQNDSKYLPDITTYMSSVDYHDTDILFKSYIQNENGISVICNSNKEFMQMIDAFHSVNESPRKCAVLNREFQYSVFVNIISVIAYGGCVFIEKPLPQDISKTKNTKEICYPLIFSASDRERLLEDKKTLLQTLIENRNIEIGEVVNYLINNSNGEIKNFTTIENNDELIDKLLTNQFIEERSNAFFKGKLIMLFSGLGTQTFKVVREFYKEDKIFREELDNCLSLVNTILNIDLKHFIFINEVFNDHIYKRSSIYQLLVFVAEYSLAKYLIKAGVKPYCVVGYSFGEYVAAGISEIYTFSELIQIVYERGRLIEKTPRTSMFSIPSLLLTEEVVKKYGLQIAINNGESVVVVIDNIFHNEFVTSLRSKGVLPIELNSYYGVHTKFMNSVLPEYSSFLKKFTPKAPQIPIYLSSINRIIDSSERIPELYWIDHLGSSFNFKDTIQYLVKLPNPLFVEISVGNDLSPLIYTISNNKKLNCLNPLKTSKNEPFLKNIYRFLGKLWIKGYTINWSLIVPSFKKNNVLNEFLCKEESVINLTKQYPDVLFVLPEYEWIFKQNDTFQVSGNLKKVIFYNYTDFLASTLKFVTNNISKVKFVSVYGKAESSYINSYHYLTKDLLERNYQKLGQPLNNSKFIVLDQNNNLCNIGEVGEIHIRTSESSKMIKASQNLSIRRFVKNPFKAEEMILKTGDLGKYNEEHEIEIVGSKYDIFRTVDKIININKVRAFVEKLVQPDQFHIILRETIYGINVLSIYFDRSVVLDRTFVNTKLSGYLRDFELPICYEFVEDIHSLQLDELKSPIKFKREIAFDDDYSKILIKIWSEILGCSEKSISYYSNFFELGGSSLKLLELVARISDQCNVTLNLGELLSNQTYRQQLQLLKNSGSAKIPLAEKKYYYSLNPNQLGLFYDNAFFVNSNNYNVSSAFEINGNINRNVIEDAFRTVLNGYDIFKSKIIKVNDEPKIVFTDTLNISFEYIENAENCDIEDLILNKVTTYNFETTPLIKIYLIYAEVAKHFLIVESHHLIIDGLSSNILINAILNYLNDGTIKASTLGFKDYIEWNYKRINTNALKQQKEFWKKEFSDYDYSASLPYDYKRSLPGCKKGNYLQIECTIDEVNSLSRFAKENNSTLFSVLFSIYFIFIHKISYNEKVIILTTVSGRVHPEIRNTVGMFTNTLPVKMNISGKLSVIEFIGKFNESLSVIFKNQDITFREIVSLDKSKSIEGRHMISDVGFGFQETDFMEEIEVKDFKVKTLRNKFVNNNVNLDLHLHFTKNADNSYFTFRYSELLFKKETIVSFSKYFKYLIDSIIENNSIKISELVNYLEYSVNQLDSEMNNELEMNFNL